MLSNYYDYIIKTKLYNFIKFKNEGVMLIVKTKVLDPTIINLDMNNPRFSEFHFKNESEVIDYLIEYENIKSLALQMIKNGYITLGERLIVLETIENKKKKYIVLEGNRRIAALKIIFKESNRFNSIERKKIDNLNKSNYMVDCDIINDSEKDEARFKITAKHIDGINNWHPTDKRVFYDTLFTQYRKNDKSSEDAINAIEKITPETKQKIKNALEKQRFLSSIYNEVKVTTPDLEPLSHLHSDVLISRVQNRLKDTLDLTVDEDFNIVYKKEKEAEYKAILRALGKATWIDKTLDTRSYSTRQMWHKILKEDKVVPGLSTLIEKYNSEKPSDGNKLGQRISQLETSKKQDIFDGKDLPTTNNDQSRELIQTNYKKNIYKLFLCNQHVEVTTFDYYLTENIKILDENNNEISKSSSVFDNITFSADNKNIAIKDNKILNVSENGEYNIRVKFYDIEKTFSLLLKIPIKNKNNRYNDDELFSEKWFLHSTTLLSSKDEYNNITAVLNCLNKNKHINKNPDNFVMLSCLIRILIEYTSKAYWNKYKIDQKKPSSLPIYINQISNNLYNNKIITKEQKKSFSTGNDLEILNAKIHDYSSNISAITIKTIFKAYKNYLYVLFKQLNK